MGGTREDGGGEIVVEIGQLSFASDGPIFQMVAAYYAGILGVFTLLTQCGSGQRPAIVELKDGDGLTRLKTDQLTIAMKEGRLDAAKMLVFHGIMLLNTAYEWTKPTLATLPKSPLFEFFRHVRNGSSHGNRFHFLGSEPVRPAQWKGHTVERNLEARQVVGDFLSPAELPLLLADVEAELRLRLRRDPGQ